MWKVLERGEAVQYLVWKCEVKRSMGRSSRGCNGVCVRGERLYSNWCGALN